MVAPVVSSVAPDGVGSLSEDTVLELVAGTNQASRNVSIQVAWIEDLDFSVSSGDFYLAGTKYTITGDTVTLSNGDATHPRFDIIVAETDGTPGVVAGTPAADPATPEVDPNTQFALMTVLVEASATTPAEVTNEAVYLEDTEWTSAESDSGTTIDLAATADPYAGTKHIEFDEVVDGDYVTLTDSSTHSASEFDRLLLYVKYTVANTRNRDRLRVRLYNSTTPVSLWVDVRHNTYGLNAGNTASYQLINIPITAFGLGGNSFDRIRIQVETGGSRTLSLNLDNINLQSGSSVVDTGEYARIDQHNDWSKAQGSSITTLTDAATIDWDMAPGNVYQVTLDGNRTMAAPTNVKPGYTYILFVYQDDTTGSRTITWNSVFKWAEATAPTLSTGTDDVDILTFVADADSNLHGTAGILNSS